jgi:signal transduction histidine kinase
MNISREIVEAMGGKIDYESELGEGTTFFVDLPWAKEHVLALSDNGDNVVVELPKAVNG